MAVTFTKSYYHTPDDTTAYNTVTGVSVTSTIGEDINKYYIPFGTANYELLSDNFTSSNIWIDVYTTSELQTRGLALYDLGSTPVPPTPVSATFHIPSQQEFADLKSIMNGLNLTTGDDYKVKLHMPFAGARDRSSAGLNGQGVYGYYWSSSPRDSSNPTYASYLSLYSSYAYTDQYDRRARAFSVRCFADEYVEPDNTWTVVAGSLGSAGIFYNSTLGLISVTDGTDTSITMKDKNEGATVVYNNGDTLTQANMGNMYQWGNYYGFPSTGTVSNTSSTQVDTTGYGENNPYSSSTFITGSEDWSNPSNDNLLSGNSDEYFQDSSTTKIYVSVYNKSGTSILHTFGVATGSTVNTLLTSELISGVTALSTTINGTALSTDTVLVDRTSYYDVTPIAPQTTYIKKIYHENQEYIVGAGGDSSDITYDNTESGMTADNVQDAIDELQDSIDGLSNNKYIESADSSNYKVSVVSTLPSTQVTNTIYIVTG